MRKRRRVSRMSVTLFDYVNEVVSQRDLLATNLAQMGITASSSETLNTLVPKVLLLPTLSFHRTNADGRDIAVDSAVKDYLYFRSDCVLDDSLTLSDFTVSVGVIGVTYIDSTHLQFTLGEIADGDIISITAKSSAFANNNGPTVPIVFSAVLETKHEDDYYIETITGHYAVSLYNIESPSSGLGLTFGPASGNWGTSEKAAHISKASETDSDMCIHNHTWDEIIEIQQTNPHAFDNCIANGCTKTVLVSDGITGILGDGAGMFDTVQKWNSAASEQSGGYPASYVREYLNTILGYFPSNLVSAIGTKEVECVYLTRNAWGSETTVTVEDKLWLASAIEMGGTGAAGDGSIFSEGTKFQRFDDASAEHRFYQLSQGRFWHIWLRTEYNYANRWYNSNSGGYGTDANGLNLSEGVAPFFSLKRE